MTVMIGSDPHKAASEVALLMNLGLLPNSAAADGDRDSLRRRDADRLRVVHHRARTLG